MKRSILGALMVVGFLADSAFASCDDTIYLTKIQVHRQVLKNAKTLGTWNMTEVDPWENNSLLSAGPILSEASGSSAMIRHPLRIVPDCGVDSVSPIVYAVVKDSVFQSKGVLKHQKVISRSEVAKKVKYYGARGFSMSGYPEGFSFVNTWETDSILVGKRSTEGDIEAFQIDSRQEVYRPLKGGLVWGRDEHFPIAEVVAKGYHQDLLNQVKFFVDSVGNGVDSVVSELAYFRYVYSFSAPASASVLRTSLRGMEMTRSNSGIIEFSLLNPQSVSIVSPSGRVVRRLDAARNVVWDLRDQAGVRVQPGVWFVQVQGLKTVPVVVR